MTVKWLPHSRILIGWLFLMLFDWLTLQAISVLWCMSVNHWKNLQIFLPEDDMPIANRDLIYRVVVFQAAVIVVFNYLAITIVFPAMIAIDVKRKRDQRHDLFCCIQRYFLPLPCLV